MVGEVVKTRLPLLQTSIQKGTGRLTSSKVPPASRHRLRRGTSSGSNTLLPGAGCTRTTSLDLYPELRQKKCLPSARMTNQTLTICGKSSFLPVLQVGKRMAR